MLQKYEIIILPFFEGNTNTSLVICWTASATATATCKLINCCHQMTFVHVYARIYTYIHMYECIHIYRCGIICNTCFVYCSRPWKFEHISIGFLSLLLRDDHQLPPPAVMFFVKSLNHDSLYVRKVRHSQFTTHAVVVL